MGLGRPTATPALAAEPQSTHRVVNDGGHDRTEDQCREDERQDEPPPRIVENEKSNIQAEARVKNVERGRVSPGQVFQRAATGRTARKQPDDGT